MLYRTITAATEIGKTTNGIAILRIMQAHGINHIAIYEGHDSTRKLVECTSIERMIEDATKSL